MDLRSRITSLLGFSEGSLPFRYLGIPVISSRLRQADCSTLVNMITSRARSWTQRFLSFAGRLQLVRSVLYAIQVFWSNIFMLPMSVIGSIERVLRQFLWKGPELGRGGSKVLWEDVCRPKSEGGLGIRLLVDCNKAALLKHIWILFTDKESLWCRWIHSNFLKRKSFWIAPVPTSSSWAWKKILFLREEFHCMFQWRIGCGAEVSFWFDSWHPRGPLYRLFSGREIYSSGVSRDARVADALPIDASLSEVLRSIDAWPEPMPIINSSRLDRFTWLGHNSGTFSISSAWEHIRRKSPAVLWHTFVWDSAIIPRHAFLL